MRPPSTTLTEQELEIMKIVWGKGEATVREVYETLLARRRIAYTTVMTMMSRALSSNRTGLLTLSNWKTFWEPLLTSTVRACCVTKGSSI